MEPNQELDSHLFEDDIDHLSDWEIFYLMFSRPYKVLEYIHKSKHEKYFFPLILITGAVTYAVGYEDMQYFVDWDESILVLALAAAGALFTLIGVYINSFLLSWTGGWIGGKGTTHELLRVGAYGLWIDLFFTVIVFVVGLTFTLGDDSELATNGLYTGVIGFLGLIAGLYSIVVSISGIMVVQGFSIWRSIGNSLLAAIPILVLAMLAFILGDVVGMGPLLERLFDQF